MITGRNITASRRQQVPLAPLKPNEVLALEAWESACRLFEEQQQLLRVAPTWDVHHASCGQSNANKIGFVHTGVDTIAGCEAACGANADCVQFEWKAVVPSGGKHWIDEPEPPIGSWPATKDGGGAGHLWAMSL